MRVMSTGPRLTLEYYRELNINRRQALFFAPPATAIGISLAYALATVVLSLLLGIPAAWALARSQNSWASRTLDPLLMLPFLRWYELKILQLDKIQHQTSALSRQLQMMVPRHLFFRILLSQAVNSILTVVHSREEINLFLFLFHL